ncbi:LysR family transcriptional regulator [soil metagenome]
MLDPLTLDQMRVLVTVAETGSFSAAARKLRRAQSGVSQAVQGLEAALGVQLFDRSGKTPKLSDAGRVLLDDARAMIQSAETMKARAGSIAHDIEAELKLAVDPVFPNEVLMRSLKALTGVFPWLPVTLYTEGLGGAEQRLREGSARIALAVPLRDSSDGLETRFLLNIPTVPVVAASHPLAEAAPPVSRAVLEQHVQLVLTDRTPVTVGFTHGIVSPRTWRFADLSTRLDFLVGGFGWCNMPIHMVRDHIDAGRLKVLDLVEKAPRAFPLHVMYERGRTPGQAGRWLLEDLAVRVMSCTEPLKAEVERATRAREPQTA